MPAESEEVFLVWPGADISAVRGMFHIEADY